MRRAPTTSARALVGRIDRRRVRGARWASVVVAALLPYLEGVSTKHEARAQTVEAPPLAPQKPGLAIEGSLGVFAPTGKLRQVSAPAPWMRLTLGWDATRWLDVYVAGDVAFLSTGRAQPPPAPRGYAIWGVELGARLAIVLNERLRLPVRLGIGAHEASDDGVLATYGFLDERSLALSASGATGIEWRAPSRHFGLFFEVGGRVDQALRHTSNGAASLSVTTAIGVHYTL